MRFDRFFGLAAIVFVAAGLVLAFLVIGTPGRARLAALDQRRVEDLDTIASTLQARYNRPSEVVPQRLPDSLVRNDPVTYRPYFFRRLDPEHYMLCATFEAPSESVDRANYEYASPIIRWKHGSGRTCYKLDVAVSPPEPQPISLTKLR